MTMSGQTSFGSSFLSSRLFVNFTVWCRHSRVHSSVRTGTYFGGVGSQFFEKWNNDYVRKELIFRFSFEVCGTIQKTLEVCGGDRRGLGRKLGSDIERKCKPVSIISAQAYRRHQDLAWLVTKASSFFPASTKVYTHSPQKMDRKCVWDVFQLYHETNVINPPCGNLWNRSYSMEKMWGTVALSLIIHSFSPLFE